MYSETIVQKRIEAAEKAFGIKLVRYELPEIQAWREHLKDAALSDLSPEEADFVRNERLMSMSDFRYWHERYSFMSRDPASGLSGKGPAPLWTAQEFLLRRIGEAEETNAAMEADGVVTMGIKVADHKARQLGHTQVARSFGMHRATLFSSQRAMASSVTDDKTQELYDRDHDILDNLPHWLLPDMTKATNFFDVKNESMSWKDMGNRILYQQGNQLSGLGQGRQFEYCHLTEVASYPHPNMIANDLLPTLELRGNLTIFESTAQGRRKWWHKFTEQVRRGGHLWWIYNFTPWYVEKAKYRAPFPTDWEPDTLTVAHAKLCEDTSPEFCFGETIIPDKEQLYWYEMKRKAAVEDNTLNFFLANYCATPEESFQHSQESAFSFQTLEKLRMHARWGVPYRLEIDGQLQ